ncbi:MAG: xanthine dehydrogenase family protein subunit M [Vicinamibacterales bacterium]
MFANDFAYYRASSLSDAHRLLAEHRGAKLLAGGHSLVPLLKLRLAAPPAVVDIRTVQELRGISPSPQGVLRIGALTTHAELASSSAVKHACPALAEAASMVGDAQVRNWGTIGGNVAHADPASDLPTVLTAAGATFVISGSGGTRTVSAHDFFVGLMTTALGDTDILTAVELPSRVEGQGTAYVKMGHPASRYAVIGVAAFLTVRNGTCSSARVAVGGLVPRATRAAGVEAALAGQSLTEQSIGAAADRLAADLGSDVLGDLYASADYRRAVAPVHAARALTLAAERARA